MTAAPASTTPSVIIVRHGETEWSQSGRHTGATDIPLTEAGRAQAVAAGAVIDRLLGGRAPALVLSSPRTRARDTAVLAGFAPQRIDPDAAEWDYGHYEGLTSAQIRERDPGWTIWRGAVPGGETAAQVTDRCDRLLASIAAQLADGPVVIFSHGHASRSLAARWLREPVAFGEHLFLSTGAVCTLGYEHEAPTIQHWNIDRSIG